MLYLDNVIGNTSPEFGRNWGVDAEKRHKR